MKNDVCGVGVAYETSIGGKILASVLAMNMLWRYHVC